MEDTVMTTFDFTPLFRTSVGYDRLASLMNSANRCEQGSGFPPYNIQKAGEDHYRITMAVAGFAESDLEITSENNRLVVRGSKPQEEEGEDKAFLYRGIANRSFEKRFNLAEHVRVSGAALDNGLLHIELEREVPEAMKPRKIEIQPAGKLIESDSKDKAA
jgi:molecular chaperone IbpA